MSCARSPSAPVQKLRDQPTLSSPFITNLPTIPSSSQSVCTAYRLSKISEESTPLPESQLRLSPAASIPPTVTPHAKKNLRSRADRPARADLPLPNLRIKLDGVRLLSSPTSLCAILPAGDLHRTTALSTPSIAHAVVSFFGEGFRGVQAQKCLCLCG